VAIKKISKRKYLTTERAVTTTRREISIMKKLTTLERAHPHIVQLIAVLETKKHLCLLQELVDGGDLADDVLERDTYAEPRAGYVMQCLTSACQHMHKHGVIHRDLKPENVLVRRGVKDFNVKVCDFGLSNVVGGSQDMLKSKCGTMLFMAPEMLARTPYDESVDVWSLGIIMYIMLSGNLPFYAEDYDEFIEMLESTPVYFPDDEWGELSDESKGLLRSILVLDPKARPTTESILGNSWVMSNCNLKPWLYGQETDPRPDDDHRDDGRDAAGGR
jgi:serine/threonine protein kinase